MLQDQPGLIAIRGDRGIAKTLNYHLVNADAYGPCTEGSKGVWNSVPWQYKLVNIGNLIDTIHSL